MPFLLIQLYRIMLVYILWKFNSICLIDDNKPFFVGDWDESFQCVRKTKKKFTWRPMKPKIYSFKLWFCKNFITRSLWALVFASHQWIPLNLNETKASEKVLYTKLFKWEKTENLQKALKGLKTWRGLACSVFLPFLNNRRTWENFHFQAFDGKLFYWTCKKRREKLESINLRQLNI
jgi:hypothetical protein